MSFEKTARGLCGLFGPVIISLEKYENTVTHTETVLLEGNKLAKILSIFISFYTILWFSSNEWHI